MLLPYKSQRLHNKIPYPLPSSSSLSVKSNISTLERSILDQLRAKSYKKRFKWWPVSIKTISILEVI